MAIGFLEETYVTKKKDNKTISNKNFYKLCIVFLLDCKYKEYFTCRHLGGYWYYNGYVT